MIKPMDLLVVANSLQSQPGEAYIRTVINRSYYAIFLYFCGFLATQGVKVPRQSAHKFLLQCFEKAAERPPAGVDKRTLYHIGRRLSFLYQRRCDADYRPDNMNFGQEDGKDAIESAQTAAEEFNNLSGSATHVHFVNTANAAIVS